MRWKFSYHRAHKHLSSALNFIHISWCKRGTSDKQGGDKLTDRHKVKAGTNESVVQKIMYYVNFNHSMSNKSWYLWDLTDWFSTETEFKFKIHKQWLFQADRSSVIHLWIFLCSCLLTYLPISDICLNSFVSNKKRYDFFNKKKKTKLKDAHGLHFHKNSTLYLP